MKILISNLKGKDLFEASMKLKIDKLVSIYTNYNENSLLDKYMEKDNVKIGTSNAIELCAKLSELIKTYKTEGEIYIATDGNFIGSMLNFTANKEGVKEIYYFFNNQFIQLPQLTLKLSKTKLKILESLKEGEQTAILIGKKVGISRAMTYKHLTNLIEDGLVGQTKRYEKYYITDAGKIAII